MKISAVGYNNLLNSNKKNNSLKQTPAFKANVRVLENIEDVISQRSLDIREYPFQDLIEVIKPMVRRLDPNLNVDISPTMETSLNPFKKKARGLKFDLSYWDQKKYYHDIITNPNFENLFSYDVRKSILAKDSVRMYMLGKSTGVGRLFRPEKGETIESYSRAVMQDIRKQLEIMPKLLLEKIWLEFDHGEYYIADHAWLNKTYLRSQGRLKFQKYRGLEE